MSAQRMKWLLLAASGILLVSWIALSFQTRKIDDGALKKAEKGTEWLTYGQGYFEQRHTSMTQITPANVKQLSLAWSFELGEGGGKQEGTPLFANGIIYAQTNWSIVVAIDARTGKEIWRYDPMADRTTRMCCGVLSRGIALYEGKVLVPVNDGRMEAIDAQTGKLIWSSWAVPKREPGQNSPYAITMAPRVGKGKVFIGNAGADFPPFRGYVSAFDTDNGKELWRFYTVPGDPAKGFENKALEAAAKTWTGEWWKYGGGGSMWDGMAYDPDENLVYVGTGNGLPWPQDLRQGKGTPHLDNLYIASIIAIDADSGQLKWHYSCTPGDQWDYDAIQHLLLADIRVNNRNRKVIMQANKNGYFYVIDRVTGEFISAGEMSQMSYSPVTGLIYVPIAPSNTFTFTAAESMAADPAQQNYGGGRRGGPLAQPAPYGPIRRGADGNPVRGGILTAWDPVTQKERWYALGGGQTDGGVLSTVSNLVIQTTPNGRLRAYTADKGEQLLDIALPLTSGVGPPMTYQLDGKQYIAVMAGTGNMGGRGGGGGGGGGGNRGGNRGGAPQEPTAAAAAAANNVPPVPAPAGGAPPAAPAAPAPPAKPRLFVYALNAPGAQR